VTESFDAELRFAEHLADLADAISMRYWRRPDTAVRTKADGTPVTEADELIEQTLRSEIAAAYPEHGVFGEEGGAVEGSGTARWILDPIDGTKNFAWGIPTWATLIALETDAGIVCGLVSAPALGERYKARRGGGATRNDETIAVSSVSDLRHARVGFTSVAAFDRYGLGEAFNRLVGEAGHDRGIGDFYGHMLVAQGSLDVMIEPELAPWDMGPLIVIVEEAGGRLTDFDDKAHIYGGSCLTTNGRLHDATLQLWKAAQTP
jgi:histidinol-phosphatase